MNDAPALDAQAMARSVASRFDVAFDQLGRDIWVTAAWMEAQGNKGYSLFSLKPLAEAPETRLPIYFLDPRYEMAWKGILFHAEGTRKRDFKGWGVRRNPPWRSVWVQLYGETDPERAGQVQAAEAAKRAEEEAAEALKRARPAEQFSQGRFEQFTTLQIGQRCAIAEVLGARAYHQFMQRHEHPEVKPAPEGGKPAREDVMDASEGYIRTVWQDQCRLMRGELTYRAEHLGDETAAAILNTGAEYFYTAATIKRWKNGDTFPLFVDGYAGQPYDDAAGVPVERQSRDGVMARFMQLLDPEWKHSGQYAQDDIEIIVGILRQQLKRLKPEG